jgi:uncharacterized protein (TIGR03435 family)
MAGRGSLRHQRTRGAPVTRQSGCAAPLVRTLLADRFGLRTHDDVREIDAFVVLRARADAAPPPGLQLSQSSCDAVSPDDRRAGTRAGWPPCGLASIANVPTADGRGVRTDVRRSANTMAEFAMTLSGAAGKPVVDLTGLQAVRFPILIRPIGTRRRAGGSASRRAGVAGRDRGAVGTVSEGASGAGAGST